MTDDDDNTEVTENVGLQTEGQANSVRNSVGDDDDTSKQKDAEGERSGERTQ